MKLNDTKERVLIAILALRKEKGKKKIKISDVAKRANISRRALYTYHSEIIDIIREGKDSPLFKLISIDKMSQQEGLYEAKLAAELAIKELNELRSNNEIEENKFRSQILGEYMQNIIVSHSSERVESDMESMQIQLQDRIEEVSNIKLKHAKLLSRVTGLESELKTYKASGADKVIKKLYLPDFRSANQSYNEENNWSNWVRDKKTLVKLAITQALDDAADSNAVILILHQYNADPEVMMNEHCISKGKYTYIGLPIPTATERKRYVNDIKKNTGLPIFAVYAETANSNAKWYRQTRKPNVPKDEIKDIQNKWQIPTINEGYKSSLILNISYG